MVKSWIKIHSLLVIVLDLVGICNFKISIQKAFWKKKLKQFNRFFRNLSKFNNFIQNGRFNFVLGTQIAAVKIELKGNCHSKLCILRHTSHWSIGKRYKNGYNWLKSDATPQVHPINIPNCRFVRKQMLENTMTIYNTASNKWTVSNIFCLLRKLWVSCFSQCYFISCVMVICLAHWRFAQGNGIDIIYRGL